VRVTRQPQDLLRRFEPTGERFIIAARVAGPAKTGFPNGAPMATAKPPEQNADAPKPDAGPFPRRSRKPKTSTSS